jgi:hypothetical protein
VTLTAEQTARFWSYVLRQEEGCWLWDGWKQSSGYGGFQIGEKKYGAHRVSYEMANGSIPEGMLVCHHCDTPRCVRPEHLFLGTPLDNMRDKIRKGRSRSGVAKLSADDVRVIRRQLDAGWQQKALAKEYGVWPNAIRQIKTGQTYQHVV